MAENPKKSNGKPGGRTKRTFKEKHPQQSPQFATTASDCIRLIDKFVEQQTVRFEDFVALWKKDGYSLLQCAMVQRFRCEQIEFTMTQFLLHLRSDNLLNCVASIYALYCTYVTQTALPVVRIRLTTHLHQRIKQVHEWAMSEEHSDLVYIIRQLEWKKAFDIALYGSELMIGTGKTCQEGGDPLDDFLQSMPTSHLGSAVTSDGLKELSGLMEDYADAKLALSGGHDVLEPLSYLRPDVADQLRRLGSAAI